jgi:CHAT domain-containing protein
MNALASWLMAGVLMAAPLTATAATAAALPLAESTGESAALRTAMSALLDDFVHVLPGSVSLIGWTDSQLAEHPWSEAPKALGIACRADQAGCARLMPRQFDALHADWSRRPAQAAPTLRDALAVSAMVELCALAWRVDMGPRCLPRQLHSATTLAAGLWNVLGYQHLFLAFQERTAQPWQLLEAMVRDDRTLSTAERAAALTPTVGTMMRNAQAAELLGRSGDAFLQWAGVFQHLLIGDKEHANQLAAMANMARLAARQGRFDRALQWEQAQRTVRETHPEIRAATACILLGQRFDIALAQQAGGATPVAGMQGIAELIAQDCPFSARALEYAQDALMQGHAAAALQVLAAAAVACDRPPVCGYTRRQQIAQMRAIASADPALLRKAALWWQARLATGDAILAFEIDMAWALAERLRSSGAPAEALAILQLLDRQIGLMRGANYGPGDLARYDDLTRLRVRLDVVGGAGAALVQAEGLRGQKLLRQLEFARWTRQLSGLSDAAALAELNERLQLGASLRTALALIPSGQYPTLRATFGYMLEDLDEREQDFREAYLERLAYKRTGGQDYVGRLRMPLRSYEKWEYASGVDRGALAEDDAYLSWLRVPGGYVGTLLARPSGRAGLAMADHAVVQTQRFIAFPAQDEALLQLYRKMLQDGAGTLRAAKTSAVAYRDGAGLLLAKAPLWQLADGTLVAGQQGAEGARRVTDATPIANYLYQRLLAPFAAQYQEAQRLIISPDGTLVYLPFESLSRQGVPLLEAIDIGYVQSLAVYGELKKRSAARRRSGAPSLLTVADPVYPGTPLPDTTNPMAAIAWRPLPGTRSESVALAALYRKPRQLLGAAASKQVLEAMADKKELRQFQTLHFATHGYVDAERSALVLSPGQGALGAYLSDQEIVQWQLESDLVLLSACNTGIGRELQGEGVVGLPYAFFMAGNLNTLMSLWPVDDAGTAALIPAYMQRVQAGEDHVTALNNTKRAFARGEYGEALRNPRIWSAFVLYGVPLAGPR